MAIEFDDTADDRDDRDDSAESPESDAAASSDDSGPDADGGPSAVDDEGSGEDGDPDDSMDGEEMPTMAPAANGESSLSGILTMIGVVAITFSLTLNVSLMIWRPRVEVPVQPVDNGTATAVETTSNAERDAQVAAARRARYRDGDNFVGEGSYGEAIRRYMEIGADQRGRMPLRLLYRLGLCHEELGLYDDALGYYREIVSREVPTRFQWLSRVSQARVWLRNRDPRRARAMLDDCILQSDREDIADHPVAAEAMYLYALASARIETADDDPDPGEPWVVPSPSHWPVESLLTWSDARPISEGPTLREQRTIVAIPEPDESNELHENPELLVRVTLNEDKRTGVRDLLEKVGEQVNQPVSFHPEAQALLDGHETVANTSRIPASIILTALTEPYGLIWGSVGNTMVISPEPDPEVEDESDGENAVGPTSPQRSGRIASETLAVALAIHPGHRLAIAARLEYGNVHFKSAIEPEDYGDAVLFYQDLVSTNSDPQTMSAAFNLGLAYRRMGNLPFARKNLLLVVDGVPEHPLSAVASYLVGRMLLDEGLYADAVSPLDAAARARIDDRSRSAAAVYAAIAHLLQDNYHQAGAVLFANRTGLTEEAELRDAAAFLNSYTRYLTLRGNRDEQRAETVYLFRSLFALGPKPTWMGSYGMLLVGRAYRDLGMRARMSDIFKNAQAEAQGIILAEMDYWVARQEFETPELFVDPKTPEPQRPQEIDDIRARGLQKLGRLVAIEGSNVWGQQAMLKLAQIELEENRADDCIQLCRRLLSIEDAPVFDVLRLMGQAYEIKGDARAAAFCFAGQVPPTPAANSNGTGT